MIKLGDLIYKFILQENRKQAKELVIQGKLSPSDFETIVKIDPSTTKKYTGWMAKQWINKDIVKNTFNNAAMMVVALVVDKNGKLIDGYNADDTQLSSTEISKFRKITGI